MENTLSNFTQFPLTTSNKADFITRAKAEILSGNYDPLTIELHFKMIEDIISELRKDPEIKTAVHNEALKYGKRFEYRGCEIAYSERKNNQYESCNDRKWNDLKAEIETLKAEIKEREKFLAAIPDGGIADPETGEIITRPTSYFTPILSIKFK